MIIFTFYFLLSCLGGYLLLLNEHIHLIRIRKNKLSISFIVLVCGGIQFLVFRSIIPLGLEFGHFSLNALVVYILRSISNPIFLCSFVYFTYSVLELKRVKILYVWCSIILVILPFTFYTYKFIGDISNFLLLRRYITLPVGIFGIMFISTSIYYFVKEKQYNNQLKKVIFVAIVVFHIGYSTWGVLIATNSFPYIQMLVTNMGMVVACIISGNAIARQLNNDYLENKMNKGRLNSLISFAHETKTPLQKIVNSVRAIYGAENNQYKTIINREVNKINKVVSDVLHLKGNDEGKIYNHQIVVSLSEYLKDECDAIQQLLFKEKNIRLERNIEKDIYTQIDPKALDRIVNNLISNAIKYTEEEGRITIVLMKENNSIYLSVADTGIGMSKEQILHIFDAFYQVNPIKRIPGYGIGLFVVQNILGNIDGADIDIKSTPGEGSKFTVHFKNYNLKTGESVFSDYKHSNPIIEKQITVVDSDMQYNKKNILIVDDDLGLLLDMKDVFSNEFNVCVATNGIEALSKMESIRPDFIISDIMMPQMDGNEFFNQVQKDKRFFNIPFIFLTAKEEEILLIKKNIVDGALDYIQKPIDYTFLLAKIARLFEFQHNHLIRGRENRYIKHKITNREKEIIQLLMKGYKNKEIGHMLNISVSTVKGHVENISSKCAINGRRKISAYFQESSK